MLELGSGPVNWAASGARGDAKREENRRRDRVQTEVMSRRGSQNKQIKDEGESQSGLFFPIFFFYYLHLDVKSN